MPQNKKISGSFAPASNLSPRSPGKSNDGYSNTQQSDNFESVCTKSSKKVCAKYYISDEKAYEISTILAAKLAATLGVDIHAVINLHVNLGIINIGADISTHIQAVLDLVVALSVDVTALIGHSDTQCQALLILIVQEIYIELGVQIDLLAPAKIHLGIDVGILG